MNGVLSKFDFRSIVIGAFVGIGLDVFGAVIAAVVSIFAGGSSESPAFAAFVHISSVMVSSLSSIIAGFVTARIARTHPLLNCVGTGVFGIFLSVVFLSLSANGVGMDNVPGLFLTLVLVSIGGFAATKMKEWGR
ncbi:MAG: hypothetical protein WBK77_09525 [Alphaproteobacteria bacterium]